MAEPTVDAQQLRAVLLSRGVSLNPPVSPEMLEKLKSWYGAPLHPDVVAVLTEFDGFADNDFHLASWIGVWPVSKALLDDWTKHPTLAFADWSLNAMVFGLDLSTGCVVSIEDKRILASSYAEFWSLLLADRLI